MKLSPFVKKKNLDGQNERKITFCWQKSGANGSNMRRNGIWGSSTKKALEIKTE